MLGASKGDGRMPTSTSSAIAQWVEQNLRVPSSHLQRVSQKYYNLELIMQSKILMEAVLECIPVGIEVVDENGTIVYINKNFETLSGVKRNIKLGKNIFDTNPTGVLAQALKSQTEIYDVLTFAQESKVGAFGNASAIFSEGKLIGAIAALRDVSEIIHLARKYAQVIYTPPKLPDTEVPKYTFSDIVGSSKAIGKAVQLSKKVATTDVTVLLEGENGTGKELFAHSIHAGSSRFKKPFLKINCAAIPENLLESELFGYEHGAFTGASKFKAGIFELADDGSLFLDEIGDMPIMLQAKLLRVLQEREIRRLGGSKTISVDVRIIAATNKDLKQMVAKGLFREDLYYRLNIFSIMIPSLRERIDDLEELSMYFIAKHNQKLKKHIEGIKPEVLEALCQYQWPGNVRELENVIEYAMITTENVFIGLDDIKTRVPIPKTYKGIPTILTIEEMERHMIERALEIYGDSLEGKKQAASALGISLATLYNKLRKQ